LITGTSSGFGVAAVVEMAGRGWRVAATMRDPSRRQALEQTLDAKGLTNRVMIEQLDVTDAAGMPRRVEGILERLGGPLDAVVHNAGVAVDSAFEDLTDAEARSIMETNFFGVIGLTRVLLPVLRKQGRGRIVVVSSDSAFAGEPANSVYVASKWAIEGWAESLAFEIQQFGLDIVLVEPGPYRTGIWDKAARNVPEGSAYGPFMEQLHAGVTKHLEKTAGDPADVGLSIADVIEKRHPRFRNPVGMVARMSRFARGKVPTPLLRKYVMRYLGIDRIAGS
jgi:NAD(P)-dependent dehydrogenase (short-subunit alcohol dehydrogenase family)